MKTLLFRINLIILGIVYSLHLNILAQSNDKVITLDGDTLTGVISKASSSSYFNKIGFVTAQNSEFINYLPGEIKGFIIDNQDYFISSKVKIEGVEQTKFLKIAVSGESSLYYYKSKGEMYIFISKGEELIQIEKNRFFNLLNLAFGDCEKMNLRNNTRIEQLKKKYKYNLGSIIKNTVEYNDCKSTLSKSKVYYVPERMRVVFGLKTGFRNADFQFLASSDDPKFDADFQTQRALFFGGFINYRFSRKISLQTEILFFKQKNSGEIPFSATNNVKHIYMFEQNSIQLPFLLQYTIDTKLIKPYFNIGSSFKSAVSGKMESTRIFASALERVIDSSVNTDYNTFGVSFIIGSGCFFNITKKNQLFLDVRYDLSFHSINGPNLNSHRQNALLLSTGFVF